MMTETLIHRRVAAARNGTNPTVICRMPSGWLVMADFQVLSGYCLLLPDPVVPSLNDLHGQARDQFLRDMALVGDALLEVFPKAVRINYEILGNGEPALHAHIIPRYKEEPEDKRSAPVWFYDWNAVPAFDAEKQAARMAYIREAVQKRLNGEHT